MLSSTKFFLIRLRKTNCARKLPIQNFSNSILQPKQWKKFQNYSLLKTLMLVKNFWRIRNQILKQIFAIDMKDFNLMQTGEVRMRIGSLYSKICMYTIHCFRLWKDVSIFPKDFPLYLLYNSIWNVYENRQKSSSNIQFFIFISVVFAFFSYFFLEICYLS